VTPEEQDTLKRARRGRNVALGLVLLGFVILFYAIAWVRIAG
jgi:hypothetical protein